MRFQALMLLGSLAVLIGLGIFVLVHFSGGMTPDQGMVVVGLVTFGSGVSLATILMENQKQKE